MGHPDRSECYRFLQHYQTPEHVIGHCKSVAAVAYRLAQAINEAGGVKAAPVSEINIEERKRENDPVRTYYEQEEGQNEKYPARKLDLQLILAAGLLHDMARVEEYHWDVCADFCHKIHLYEEEKIVRVHMQYEFTNDAEHLTEIDLVCLGDRLSLEDRYVGLDKRMDYIIAKAERNGHGEVKPRILAKKEQTRVLLRELEDRIGSIDQLMATLDYEKTEDQR